MTRSDSQLLDAFATAHDETAFADLVHRRIDFVYAAALRQLAGDAHAAQDVAQEVFVRLARSAGALKRHPALLGWLCMTTRHAARDRIRTEQRRQHREHLAMSLNDSSPEADWRHLEPVLDDALARLPAPDREMILARFFDGQRLADVGRTFGLSDNAVQKRVIRALDRLHTALAEQGITSTAAALALALTNHATIAAPAGLAANVTAAAIARSTATKLMGMSKLQLACLGTLLTTGAIALGFYAHHHPSRPTEPPIVPAPVAHHDTNGGSDPKMVQTRAPVAAVPRMSPEPISHAPSPSDRPEMVRVSIPDGDAVTLFRTLEIYTGQKIVRDPSLKPISPAITVIGGPIPKPKMIALIEKALREQAGIAIEHTSDGRLIAKPAADPAAPAASP
jgi:RNA polymerase sigma factor (sigma-70 family)